MSGVSTAADKPREVRVPPPKSCGDTWDQLKRPLLFRQHPWINIRVLLATRSPRSTHRRRTVHRNPFKLQMAIASTKSRDRVGDMDFNVRQPTVAEVQTYVRAMAKDGLVLLNVRPNDQWSQNGCDAIPSVVMPETTKASPPRACMDMFTPATKPMTALPRARQI